MQKISEFLERQLGLHWDAMMPVVFVDIIPAGAECVMAGGYLEPQKLKEALLGLYHEYIRSYRIIEESIDKLGKYAMNLPSSPELAITVIEKVSRALEGNQDRRRVLEGSALWQLSQYTPLKKGTIRWRFLGGYTQNRVELYNKVLVRVAEEFRLYFHELKEVVACYWLAVASLHWARDNEDRIWQDFLYLDDSVVNELALLITWHYCQKGRGSLSRCFQLMLNAIGDEQGMWMTWRELDKDQFRASIQIARQRAAGLTIIGFEEIIKEVSQLY